MKARLLYSIIFSTLLFFRTICPGSSYAQDNALSNGYPLVSGIMLLDADGTLLNYFPFPGNPSDADVYPDGSGFVLVTAQGSFQLFNTMGDENFQINFENLIDVDVLESKNRFLLTSRYGRKVFFFNRNNGEQREIPYEFTSPTDADLLPSGNLLISDADEGRVFEITQNGQLVWEFDENLKQPMDALRLPNGNTLISDFDNHRVLEIDPERNIVQEYHGFDHPIKLNARPNGEIVVADSDNQRLAKINITGEIETIRDRMNYVKSSVMLPGQTTILALIEARYPPPDQTPVPSQPESQTSFSVWISETIFSAYVFLPLALILWFAAVRFANRIPAPHIWLILSYTIVIGLAYHYQTLAASTANHHPLPAFWLSTLLLAIFAYRETVCSFRAQEHWQNNNNQFHLPLSIHKIILLFLWTLIPILFQYLHVHRSIHGWPWYLPMLGWIIGLFWFFKWLFYNPTSKTSFMNPLLNELPFTSGSVGGYGGQEDMVSTPAAFQITRQAANQIVIAICLLAACLYTIGVTEVPTDFHGDEAEVAMNGIELREQGRWNFFILNWYNLPNLFYLIPGWVMWLFGDNRFGIRMAGALTGLAAIPFFYLLARRVVDLAPSVIATFLFAASTYVVHYSRIGIGYNQTTLLTVLAFYFWIRGVQTRNSLNICLSGFVAGIGMLSYQASHLIMPLILVSFVLLFIIRILPIREVLMSFIVFLFGYWIAMSPLMGNYLHDPHASISRADGITIFSQEGRDMIQGEYAGQQSFSEMLQGQFERTLLAPISYYDRSPYLVNFISGGLLDPIPAVLFASGVLVLIFRLGHPASVLLLFWAFATLIVGSAFTNRAPAYQRLVGLSPWLILIAAPVLQGVLGHISRMGKWSHAWRISITTIVLAILLIMSMHRYFHQIQSEPQLLDEWTRIARYLDEEASPTHYTYFFGPPHVWFEYGTIKFLAPNAKGENVERPERFLQYRVQRRGPVTFLLVRSNRQYLHKLRELYPGGIEEHWTDSKGKHPFTTYTVYF